MKESIITILFICGIFTCGYITGNQNARTNQKLTQIQQRITAVEQPAKLAEFRRWLDENVRVVGPLTITNAQELTGLRIIQVVVSPPILTVSGTNVVVNGNTIYRNDASGSAIGIDSTYATIMHNLIR